MARYIGEIQNDIAPSRRPIRNRFFNKGIESPPPTGTSSPYIIQFRACSIGEVMDILAGRRGKPLFLLYSDRVVTSTKPSVAQTKQSQIGGNRGCATINTTTFLRGLFGYRVQKVSIDAGFTCPNVDGTVALGGCTFCDNRSFSPSRRLPRQSIVDQIDEGIRRLKRRYDCKHFMAYFQPATNTYAPVEKLRPLFEQSLQHPDVVALAIGTRPDCVPDDVLDLLSRTRGADLSIRGIWNANSARPFSGLDEPGPSPRCLCRCRRAQPRAWF